MLTKLSQKGFAHIIAPLVVVVAIAAVGTYVLVKSHAQVPVDNYKAAVCSVTASPTTIAKGGTSTLSVTIKNTGTVSFYPSFSVTKKLYTVSGGVAYSGTGTATTYPTSLFAGTSRKIGLGGTTYSAGYAKQSYTVTGQNPSFSCTTYIGQS
ncbi:MAG: hypothetical protein QFB87_03330 [Patescibacteria group bacterium]|nr:hypothetical protein [Patescibacteria group bacterium]